MGSNAVPFLIKVLKHKPSKLSKAAEDKLYDGALGSYVPKLMAKALPSAMHTEERRESAAFFIGEIGPDAARAIPTLLAILTDPSEEEELEGKVRCALLAMGEKLAPYVPEFIGYLKSEDRDTRQFGAQLLASTGPKAHAALPALLQVAQENDLSVNLSVAVALWNIARQTNAVLSIYLRSLQSTNSICQQLGLIYLRGMGPAAQAAGPTVQALLRAPDDLVRRDAQKVLMAIDGGLFQSTQREINQDLSREANQLVQAIQSADYLQHFRALEVLWVLGPAAKPAVPALVGVLQGQGPKPRGAVDGIALWNARRNAAAALAEIGPEARAAVPALVERLSANDYSHAGYCRALGCIGPDAKAACAALERAMSDENAGVRLAAATALTQINPEGSSNAVAVLRSLQHDPEMATVWKVSSQGMATKTSEKNFQNPTCRYFRAAASVPLWRLGLEPAPSVEAIVQELKRSSDADDLNYVELLGDIGPEAKPALETLKTFLDPDRYSKLRQAAAIAIRKIAPDEAANLGLPGILVVP